MALVLSPRSMLKREWNVVRGLICGSGRRRPLRRRQDWDEPMDIRSVTAAVRTWPLSLGQKGALPNFYDLVLFAFIAAAFTALAHGAREMEAPLASLDLAPVTLDPVKLPEYALRTTLRMFAAILASLA